VSLAREIALVTAAVVIGTTAWVRSARGDDACTPAVEVTGDRALASELTADLARRGVAAAAATGCPRTTATVMRAEELLHVVVTDEYGRSHAWDVRDIATASALVESWTKREIDEVDELELGPAAPASTESTSLPPIAAMVPALAPVETDAITPVPVATSRTRGGVSVAFESATAGDSAWFGGAVGGCVRVGVVCAGGRGRVGYGAPEHHTFTSLDLLATAELPIARGGFVVAPGATLGVGWTRATTDDPHAVDPSMDVGGVRAGVQLGVAHALAGAVAIEAIVAFDGTVLGMSDAPAALPRALGRVGLGLRYGGR
jgi:hypothetical protein